MIQIEITDGVKLVVDPEKFDVKSALKLQLPNDDLQLTFDLTVTNVSEQAESKVQNVVSLRSA